jgi:flagellar motility protein MotE (MotC chaperone)
MMKLSGRAIILILIILSIGVTAAAVAAGWIDLKKMADMLPISNDNEVISELEEQNKELKKRLAELEEMLQKEKEQRLKLEQVITTSLEREKESTESVDRKVNDIKDYKKVGEYYAGMEPLTAAGILERMTPEVAGEILTGMDKEDAGEIRAVMEPERAVQVTEMIAICEALNKDKKIR